MALLELREAYVRRVLGARLSSLAETIGDIELPTRLLVDAIVSIVDVQHILDRSYGPSLRVDAGHVRLAAMTVPGWSLGRVDECANRCHPATLDLEKGNQLCFEECARAIP